MYRRRQVLRWMAAAVAAVLLAGCAGDADHSDQEAETETGKADESGAAEKGYDLPVDGEEKEAAQEDCTEMLSLAADVCPEILEETPVLLSDDMTEQAAEAVAGEGVPAAGTDLYRGLKNYDLMERFLRDCESGRPGSIVTYEIYDDGRIGRKKFICDGEDMYLFAVTASWKDGQAVLGDVSYSRMREWSFTEKGWFFYELCTPEYPEVTEVIYSNAMMRVVPLEEEYAKVTEAFLEPVAYNGNNLFWTDWDAEHMDGIDYNGLFEYLYEMRTGKDFDKAQYQDGIPGGQFEELMTAALPVTPEQLRGYAAYDAETERYEWISLGVGNRTLGPLTGAIPEVVGMEENGDGSVTLTVDAVCESIADDAFLTHYLTIQMDEEDQVRYLSNVVSEGQEDALPEYVYRIQR